MSWVTEIPANSGGRSFRIGWDRLVGSLRMYVLPVVEKSWRLWQKLPGWFRCLILCALGGYFLRDPFLEFILPHIAFEGSLAFKGTFEFDVAADLSYDP